MKNKSIHKSCCNGCLFYELQINMMMTRTRVWSRIRKSSLNKIWKRFSSLLAIHSTPIMSNGSMSHGTNRSNRRKRSWICKCTRFDLYILLFLRIGSRWMTFRRSICSIYFVVTRRKQWIICGKCARSHIGTRSTSTIFWWHFGLQFTKRT